MINIHNHTIFSDGKYKPESIIKKAIQFDLKVVGISDHYLSTKVGKSLPEEKIEEYLTECNELKEKYKDKIKVVVGLEIDFSLLRTNFVTFPYHLLKELDFLLLEYVNDKAAFGLNIEEVLKLKDIEIFGLPIGLAHNNISENFGKENYDRLITQIENTNIFIELCTSTKYFKGGVTPFYYLAEEFFDKIKGRKVLLAIGSDTHDNLQEVGNIQNAYNFIQLLHLEENLIFLK